MPPELGWSVPSVVHAVNVRNGDARQFCFRDPFQAADIYPVHLAHGRVISDTKHTDAAVAAKVMVVPFLTKDVTGEFFLTRDKAELIRGGHSRPEAIAPTD